VAKYCGPQDVLKHCREVSSVWAQAGLCNELWDLYSDTCGFPARHSSESAFQSYVRGRTLGYKLALFVADEVVIYDCLTGLTERLKGHSTDNLSSWVLYSDKIICFGGGYSVGDRLNLEHTVTPLGKAHMYEHGNHHQLQNMVTPRFRSSGIIFQGKLYVFGGIGEKVLNSAEKLNLKPWETITEERWQSLPNSLQHRYNPSLCIDLEYIYVSGWAPDIERYCSQTNTFHILSIRLTLDTMAEIVLGRELLILSKKKVLRADLEAGTVKTSQVRWDWDNFPYMNIVPVGQLLYRLSARGIDKYNLETLTSTLVLDVKEVRRTASRSGCGCCHRLMH